jgi:hypothetical protein
VDLSTVAPSSVVKAFQLWASFARSPLDFYIIGSNDGTNWTALYDSENVNKLTTRVEGSTGGEAKYHSSIISISNTNHYTHIGLFVLQSARATDGTLLDGAGCQELRLFS